MRRTNVFPVRRIVEAAPTGRSQGHLCPQFDAGFEFMPCYWMISYLFYQAVQKFTILSADFNAIVHICNG